MDIVFTLTIYALGMVLAAVGSRLSARCTVWCCALCGLPMWVVGGMVAPVCLALPQLVFAFLAAGSELTALAVGVALAGAVTDVGLVLALCLLRRSVVVERGEYCRKCLLLLAAALVVVLTVREGRLSYTGIGLLMLLFAVFVLESIACQHRFLFEPTLDMMTDGNKPVRRDQVEGYTAHTMAFPVMSIGNSLKNLFGVVAGLTVLCTGAEMLLYSAATMASLTGTIQALWAATLISFGFCLPLLAEVLHHPFGSVWKRFSERCRTYPPQSLPMQMLNSAIVSLTLALPLSSLMYRSRLPLGAQFRMYDLPVTLALGAVLLLPPLFKKRLYRPQGAACLALYLLYLAGVLLAPLAGA